VQAGGAHDVPDRVEDLLVLLHDATRGDGRRSRSCCRRAACLTSKCTGDAVVLPVDSAPLCQNRCEPQVPTVNTPLPRLQSDARSLKLTEFRFQLNEVLAAKVLEEQLWPMSEVNAQEREHLPAVMSFDELVESSSVVLLCILGALRERLASTNHHIRCAAPYHTSQLRRSIHGLSELAPHRLVLNLPQRRNSSPDCGSVVT